jgi:hypothetical protein
MILSKLCLKSLTLSYRISKDLLYSSALCKSFFAIDNFIIREKLIRLYTKNDINNIKLNIVIITGTISI